MSKYGCDFERLRYKDGAARYVACYAKKMYQKEVPPCYRNVGRWWAASRGVAAEPVGDASAGGDQRRAVLTVLSDLGWSYANKMLARLDDGTGMEPPTTLYNVAGFLKEKGVPWDTFMRMVESETDNDSG